jgi:CD109 antigen
MLLILKGCLIYSILDGTLHWEEGSSGKTESSPWLRPYYRPRSADIEITSYVLLAYTHRKDIQIGLPIAQWLAQQRNSIGGYSSTQVCREANTDLYAFY